MNPAASASLTPLPAPAGLLAQIYLPRPADTWIDVQSFLSGATGVPLVSGAAAVTDLLGIPAAYSPSVVLDRPVVGVLIDGEPPRLLVALPLRSGRELVAALSTGQSPPFVAREHRAEGVVVLERRGGSARADAVLAVAGQHLLVGGRVEDLTHFGPFVVRTLARQPMPEGPIVVVVPKAALVGPCRTRLQQAWQKTRSRLVELERAQRTRLGRAPDFAEPEVALGVGDRAIADGARLLGSLRGVTLLITPQRGRLEVEAELDAEPGGPAARFVSGLPLGDARALLRAPRAALLAASLRSNAELRRMRAAALGGALTELLGVRLRPGDQERVAAPLADLALGRGDRLTVAVVPNGAGVALAVHGDVSDAAALDHGFRGLARWLEVPAVAAPVTAFIGAPNAAIDRLPLGSSGLAATRARLVFTAPPGAAVERQTAELAWLVRGERWHAAFARDVTAVLAASLDAEALPEPALAAVPEVVAAVERAGTSTSIAVHVHSLLLLPDAKPGSTPLFLALGRDEHRGRVRVELGPEVLAAWLGAWLGLDSGRKR